MPVVYYAAGASALCREANAAPNVTAWCMFIFRELEIGGEG